MEIKPRKLEIIEAAGEVLTKYGVSGLTIKQLAAKMGFVESALYRYFKSKDEIILTMLQYLAENMDERLSNCLISEQNPNERVKAFFNSQFEFFLNKPHFLVAVFSDSLFENNEAINDAIKCTMSKSRTYLLQVIKDGQQQNIFNSEIPAEDLVHIIMGSFRLLMLQWRMSGFTLDVKKKGNTLMLNLIKLIK